MSDPPREAPTPAMPTDRPRILGYALVPVIVGAALLARWPLWPVLGGDLAFLFFWPAVAACAWLGGIGPGLVATALSAAASTLLLPPYSRLGVARPADWFGLCAFTALASVVCLFVETLHRATRRAELARESLRVTFASIGDGAIVTDTAGAVTYLNPAAEGLTGWTAVEAEGRPLADIFRIVNEETRAPADDPVARALRTGRVVGLANHTVLIARDGTGRAIEDSAAPVRAESGAVAGCVLVFHDVTGRRRAEADLRHSESRFRTLVEALPQLIWGTDAAGACNYLSRQWVEYTGVPEADHHGAGWQAAVHPDDRGRAAAAWAAAAAGDAPYDIEYRLRRRDGAYRWFQARGVPVRDAAGRVAAWYGSSTDVDDLKRAEGALREADRRKDEFLALLAHELRNPLAPIVSSARLLAMNGSDGEVARAAGTIERQGRHLARLVDDLLDVSRVTRGTVRLRRERTDLAAAVALAVETCRPLIDERGHELTVDLPPGAVPLDADPARLAQVLDNLLTNAAKYTPPGGRVGLSAAVEGGRAVVRVRDTGVGLHPEAAGRVFDLFARVVGDHEYNQGGLGIGLFLVKRLVELHGGTVEAHSDGPGRGSEFVVRLPLSNERGGRTTDESGAFFVSSLIPRP